MWALPFEAENALYQTSISDQRATINILNKALARLKQFYAPEFAQVPHALIAAHGELVGGRVMYGVAGSWYQASPGHRHRSTDASQAAPMF